MATKNVKCLKKVINYSFSIFFFFYLLVIELLFEIKRAANDIQQQVKLVKFFYSHER